jgi:hypothetical protein
MHGSLNVPGDKGEEDPCSQQGKFSVGKVMQQNKPVDSKGNKGKQKGSKADKECSISKRVTGTSLQIEQSSGMTTMADKKA